MLTEAVYANNHRRRAVADFLPSRRSPRAVTNTDGFFIVVICGTYLIQPGDSAPSAGGFTVCRRRTTTEWSLERAVVGGVTEPAAEADDITAG